MENTREVKIGLKQNNTKHIMKKIVHILEVVCSWLLVVLAVLMMMFATLSLSFADKVDRTLFGYHFLVVQSDSMAATDFKKGDVIISREVDTTTLNEGDIITFISQDSANYGQIVTHKIRSRTVDSMGRDGFVTYGTTTGANDRTVVSAGYVIGQYQGKLPGLGNLVDFLRTGVGFILCVLVPFLMVVGVHGAKVLLTFLRWRKEQMREIEDMQARIEYLKGHIPLLKERYSSAESQAALAEVERLLMLEGTRSATQEETTLVTKKKPTYQGELSPHTSKRKLRRRQAEEERQRKATWMKRK